MEEITSRNNPAVKAAAALKELKERKSTGLFLLEGARLCKDAALNGVTIKQFFATEKAKEKYFSEYELLSEKAENSFLIPESVAEKLSDTKNSQGFFAVCRQPGVFREIKSGGMYVFTDNVQNPDNMGAIVRTAEAMGADGIIVNSGCDIYSPKALRASMGALLRFPVIKTDTPGDILTECKNNNMKIFASVVDPSAADVTKTSKDGGCVLIIGNEGNGISEETLSLSTHRITIPMKGKAESLNASAAATVLIWEFMKDR
ncbi:MAG: RNA methyltransferase [Clostridia bacterium]|nr:RNA methyltransferase [Clostridia bacterium]